MDSFHKSIISPLYHDNRGIEILDIENDIHHVFCDDTTFIYEHDLMLTHFLFI